ncbi:amino acid ABC transporter permease [uncultured Pseudokineococcus sp.]|uniref:amino acid ABC transporter permease n=1 Tax=uncultured Pseudokineococcus sp. TaxID=1642928 RepID=UPI00263610E0|nr:amino acid ABC transporter permease [uncultured Pseudokineococcus sp.]
MTSVLYDVPGPAARRRSRVWSAVGAVVVVGLVAAALARLASQGALAPEAWSPLADPDVWTFLLEGLLATLRAAALAAVLAAALGFVLAVLRRSSLSPVRWLAAAVVEVFRGLPVVLLMFLGVIALGLSIFQGVVFGLVVYNAAVIAEVLRAGIAGLPRGQGEAAEAIGMSRFQVLSVVLLPQAVRTMLPTLVSQFVVLLKDTSLGYIVGYAELLRHSRLMAEFFGSDARLPMFVVAAALYITVNFLLGRLAVHLERRGSSTGASGRSLRRRLLGGTSTAGAGAAGAER